jgi:hypothetical protein
MLAVQELAHMDPKEKEKGKKSNPEFPCLLLGGHLMACEYPS